MVHVNEKHGKTVDALDRLAEELLLAKHVALADEAVALLAAQAKITKNWPDPIKRKPLVELVTAHAKIPAPPPPKEGEKEGDQRRFTYGYLVPHQPRLTVAWEWLISLDALQGKTEDEVMAILGPPTSRSNMAHQTRLPKNNTMLEWYAESSMHVNPYIRVAFDEKGKAQSMWIGRK